MIVDTVLQAAKKGDLGRLQLLNLQGTPPEDLVDSVGATCIHYAARAGNLDVLKYLTTTCGFPGNSISSIGATPAHDAAATGHLNAMKWLLSEGGCSVADQDASGATVTHLAARYGHLAVLKWLVTETGVSLTTRTRAGALPLHFAAAMGDLDSVKYLVEHEPAIVNLQMENGATACYLAAQEAHIEVLKYLVQEGGSSLKVLAYDGMSCLHAAAQMGHLSCVAWLISEQGMSPDERDFDGASPAHFAAGRGHVKVLEWLLQHGARILLDNLGGTPLHDAAEHGQAECVYVLLKHGCNAETQDNSGLTPADLAEQCMHRHVANTLRKKDTAVGSTNYGNSSATQYLRYPPNTYNEIKGGSMYDDIELLRPRVNVQHVGASAVRMDRVAGGNAKCRSAETGEVNGRRPSITINPPVLSIPPPPATPPPTIPSTARPPASVKNTTPEIFHYNTQTDTYIDMNGGENNNNLTCNDTQSAMLNNNNMSEASNNLLNASHQFTQDSNRNVYQNSHMNGNIGDVIPYSPTRSTQSAASQTDPIHDPQILLIPLSQSSKNFRSGSTLGQNLKDEVRVDCGKDLKPRRSLEIDDAELANPGTVLATRTIFESRDSNDSSTCVSPTRMGTPGGHFSYPSPKSPLSDLGSSSANVSSATTTPMPPQAPTPPPLPPIPPAPPPPDFSKLRMSTPKKEMVGKPASYMLHASKKAAGKTAANMDLIAELKAVRGAASLKKVPAKTGNSTLYGNKDVDEISNADSALSVNSDNSESSTFSALELVNRIESRRESRSRTASPVVFAKLTPVGSRSSSPKTGQPNSGPPNAGAQKAVILKNQTPRARSESPKPKKDSQALTGEFDPKNFLDKVPPKDTTGRDFPQWKRQLLARQLAEKALQEAEERKKKEEEEARFRNMPVWKRALIEKKEAEARAQRELEEDKEVEFPQPPIMDPVMVPADRDGLPLAPWQLELQRRKGQAN